jgi:hypothetical protein
LIYQLLAPSNLAPFPDIFAALPPRILGMAIWLLFTVLALLYVLVVKDAAPGRLLGVPVPMLFAAAIFTGLFISTYYLVDEVSINLKHSYNLYHYGKFSMSPERWVAGTVETVYYLLHAPFARSQHSLIVANYVISLLVGLLHLPLAAYALDPKAGLSKGTLQLCGFALCLPLATTFSSGFGNGLVSLVFLAAIGSALNGKESRSLILSGLLPLLRPDALLLSAVNVVVIMVSRRLARKQIRSLREHALPLLLPPISAGVYYSFCRAAYGTWVPTPVYFKTIRWSMFSMTHKVGALKDILVYFSHGAPVLGLTCLILVLADFLMRGPKASWLAGDRKELSLGLYTLATMPLFLFYTVAHSTLGDYSFQTYSRYWVAFDLTLQLFVLAVLANVDLSWGLRGDEGGSPLLAWRQQAALIAFLCLSIGFTLGNPDAWLLFNSGRTDSAFAGAFTETYLPPGLTVSTTEMDTFGLMIERPVIDLWGYTNPAIAFSGVCNGDRIRSNDRYFLQVKPDVYWPYWFTGLNAEDKTANFDDVEESFATFHHTSKVGDFLGDMSEVLTEYDVVVIHTKWNHLAYLVRKSVSGALLESLEKRGFSLSRQRPLDLALFHRLYDGQKRVTYRCR